MLSGMIDAMESHHDLALTDLALTKLNWSTGIILAVKLN
jgi:hypothetical protein